MVARGIAVILAASGAELEATRHKPRAASSRATGAVGLNGKQLSSGLSISGFQANFARPRPAQPEVGVILICTLKSELAIHGLRHQETPAVSDAIEIFVLVYRDIVDFTLLESTGSDVIHRVTGWCSCPHRRQKCVAYRRFSG